MSVIRMINGRQVTLRDRWYHGTSRARMAWMGAEEWQPHAGMILTNIVEAGVYYADDIFITVEVPDYLLWSEFRPDISSADIGADRGNVIAVRSTVGPPEQDAIIISDGVPDAPNALALVILSEEAAADVAVISIEASG